MGGMTQSIAPGVSKTGNIIQQSSYTGDRKVEKQKRDEPRDY